MMRNLAMNVLSQRELGQLEGRGRLGGQCAGTGMRNDTKKREEGSLGFRRKRERRRHLQKYAGRGQKTRNTGGDACGPKEREQRDDNVERTKTKKYCLR